MHNISLEKSNLAKIISNYGSRLWNIVSAFIFIPLYLQFLGTENYGLISFYALLLGIISFADSGMSSAIIKEFSQNTNPNYKYTVFRKLENIYVLLCIILCGIIFFSAEFIAKFWLSSTQISPNRLIYYIRLIGFGITSQLINSLYFGALYALNNQVRANMFQFIWSFARTALVFALFVILSSDLEVYFVWQIFCNIAYILLLRYFIITKLKLLNGDLLKIKFKKLPKHIKSYIGGMIFIAIISAVNIQADKLVSSSLFDLTTFGFYNIATSLSQIPVAVAAPLVAFAFPLFSKFSTESAKSKNIIVFNKVYYIINLSALLITMIIILFTDEILFFWTKGKIPTLLLPAIIFDARILTTGGMFLALQFPLFYILLAKGRTRYIIYQGIVQLTIGLPILYFCSYKFGLYGLPIPWLIINMGSYIYLFIVVSKKFLPFATEKFFKIYFFSPIIIVITVNIILYISYLYLEFYFLFFVGISCTLSVILSVFWLNFKTGNSLFNYKNLYEFPHE